MLRSVVGYNPQLWVKYPKLIGIMPGNTNGYEIYERYFNFDLDQQNCWCEGSLGNTAGRGSCSCEKQEGLSGLLYAPARPWAHPFPGML